jgi:hypothetical protein
VITNISRKQRNDSDSNQKINTNGLRPWVIFASYAIYNLYLMIVASDRNCRLVGEVHTPTSAFSSTSHLPVYAFLVLQHTPISGKISPMKYPFPHKPPNLVSTGLPNRAKSRTSLRSASNQIRTTGTTSCCPMGMITNILSRSGAVRRDSDRAILWL